MTLVFGNPLCDICGQHHPMNWDCEAEILRAREVFDNAVDRALKRDKQFKGCKRLNKDTESPQDPDYRFAHLSELPIG